MRALRIGRWGQHQPNCLGDKQPGASASSSALGVLGFERESPLMRRAPPALSSSRLFWVAELLAIVVTVVLVLLATHLQVSQCLATKKRQQEKSQKVAYPWPSIPAELLEVGPSFATNFQSGLRQCLAARGLSPSPTFSGEVALVSFLIPAEAAGKTQPRALLERHNAVPPGCLGGKRALASHLQRLRLEALGPPTFLSPQSLRKCLEPRVRFAGLVEGVVSEATADGLWFLKHSTMDRNEGVICFKGATNMLAHWDKLPKSQRSRYVAQAEVPRPMLLEGRKMMVRAYVVTLPQGRCFLNRELLLKGHPQPYDSQDPDPLRHVISCVKYDGVISARGTLWPHYAKVWPKVSKMMTAVLGPAAVGHRKYPFSLRDDSMMDILCNHIAAQCQDLCSWLRWGSKAGALLYNLMGVDIIVDQDDLRPWLIELNPGPAMGIDQRDPLATELRAEVMEEISARCFLTHCFVVCRRPRRARTMPGVQSACVCFSSSLGKVSFQASAATKTKSRGPRGFVEIF
ncbi:unnamed protein product [Effrenium voratum]|nr:unnamed protein product [Effrenium voratum]